MLFCSRSSAGEAGFAHFSQGTSSCPMLLRSTSLLCEFVSAQGALCKEVAIWHNYPACMATGCTLHCVPPCFAGCIQAAPRALQAVQHAQEHQAMPQKQIPQCQHDQQLLGL